MNRMGLHIATAIVGVAVLVIHLTCMPDARVRMDIPPSSQPYQIKVHLVHEEEDTSMARFRWAMIAVAGTAIILMPILIIAWRAQPWAPFKKGAKDGKKKE